MMVSKATLKIMTRSSLVLRTAHIRARTALSQRCWTVLTQTAASKARTANPAVLPGTLANVSPAQTFSRNSRHYMLMLMRMYYADIKCDEKCLLCGASSTTVRTWLNHFAKCNNKLGNPRLSDALTRKKDIVKNRKLELASTCRNKTKASDKIDDGNGSGKRKAEAAGLPPQREQFGIGRVAFESDTKHRSVAIGMMVPQFGFIVLK
jgi:hypothetical protein